MIYFLIFLIALFSQNNKDIFFQIIGLIVYFSGLILTFIGYYRFTKEKDLINKFPFNVSRNPTYFFSFVSIFGIVLFTNSFILFSVLIIQLISTHIIILREEKFLEKRYGKEYLDYKSKVKRYL
jgi:protein-S-isoprenylcysteine O-methyltransferase Ste14